MPPLPNEALLADVRDMFDALDPVPDGPVERCQALASGPTPADLAVAVAVPVKCVTVRFRCPFCRRFSRAKAGPVADHMTRCWRNPAVRACKTCEFFQPGNGLGPSEYCNPGEQCSCGVVDEACLHEDGPHPFESIAMGCPLWRLRGCVEADGGES